MSSGGFVPRRVSRMQLGVLLRDWRDRAKLEPADVAKALEWHVSKVSKLEHGTTTAASAEVDRLIELFGVTDEDVARRIRELGRGARGRSKVANVPDWAQTYAELELGADEIKLYDGELVLGLLQTDAYANALLRTSIFSSPDEAQTRAEERSRRQERLTDADAPKLWVILGEAALHRVVGGADVLRGQLQRLRELIELSNVTVQVVPFANGEHVALGTSFCLLEFHDPAVAIAYVEGLTSAEYLDKQHHTDAYRLAFTKLQIAAADERRTERMLDRRIAELRSG